MSRCLRLSLNRDSVSHMNPFEAREYVAAEVRAALARDGRSAAQLAADAGIPRSSLSKKMRATVAFTVEEVLAIALALEIDPAALLPNQQSRAVA